MARTDTLPHFLTDVADAIRTKAGTSGTIQASTFDTAIANIPSGGGGTVEEKDVNFYDYDGTLLHSYTAQEFQALASMPENPTHDGLTSQGWNWSLSDAKTYVTNHGICDIGQMYTPTDGKTKIYIHLEDARTTPELRLAVNGTVTVDWGDGGATQDITGTSTSTFIRTPHEYATGGDYVIELSSSGNFYIYGDTGMVEKFITSYTDNLGEYYLNSVKKVVLGTKAKISNFTFAYMRNLEEVIIPYGYGNFYMTDLFNGCYNLKCVIFPSGLTSMEANSNFSTDCYKLKNVIFPSSITGTISKDILKNSYFATRLCVPDGATTLSTNTFSYSRIKRLELPINVSMTSLPNGLLNNNIYIESLKIPNNITSIGKICVSNRSLKSVQFPNALQSIGDEAFYNCTCLPSLTFPSTLTSIGSSAFYNCYTMSYYDFSACEQIPTLGTNVFSGIPSDCKIIVPNSLYNDWVATSGWSSYSSKIISKSDWDALQA